MLRPGLLALTLLMLVVASCTRTPGPRIARRPEPGPDASLPHVFWEAEFSAGDVRLAKEAGERVLMVYWTDGEGADLAFLNLAGEVLGRKQLPGLIHVAGYRVAGDRIEVLYQSTSGVILMFGVAPGGNIVSSEFEEPYPWDVLALAMAGPLEILAEDNQWIYRMGLVQKDGGWLLKTTITGPAGAR